MASMKIEVERLRNSFKCFGERADHFEKFHSYNFIYRFKGFIRFFEKEDDVFYFLARLFHDHPGGDAMGWYEKVSRAGKAVDFPEDRVSRLALQYMLIYYVSTEKIDLKWLASNYFPGGFFEEKMHNFKKFAIFHL